MSGSDRACMEAYEESAFSDNREWDTRSTDELEAEISELCTHIDAATCRLLRAIAEFDRREAWGVGFPSTAHWLSWRVGIDLVTAREKVRVARALEGLPRISEAFRQGKVSYSKVRAITRIGSRDNEEYLLYIAENGTTEHVERVVRGYRRACRVEGVEEARRHQAERYLEMYPDEDGMVVIRGRLPQEIAALLEKALEAAMEALKEEGRCGASEESCATPILPPNAGIAQPGIEVDPADDSAESSETSGAVVAWGLPDCGCSPACPGMEPGRGCEGDDSAESSGASGRTDLEVSAESSGESPSMGRKGTVDSTVRKARHPSGRDSAESCRRESLAQKRVDALGLLAEAALGRGLGRTERGEPYQVVIHVDSAVLAGGSEEGLCELENGEGMSAETCRRLA